MHFIDSEHLPPIAERWLHVVVVGVGILYFIFIAVSFRYSGPIDGDQYLTFHSLQYWNAALFGIAKQWTPLMCAGLSLAGEPQVPFMSLSMALTYLWGPLWGVRLTTCIYLLAGWTGAFLYAGLWSRIKLQRALAASLFIGNGFFFCRLGLGHFDFIPFLILPLLLWGLHKASFPPSYSSINDAIMRTCIPVLLIGAASALVIDGSPVAIIHLLFWVSLYAVTLSIYLRRVAPTMLLAAALVLAVCLDAGYLWPMLKAQVEFPRLTEDRFTSALSLLWFAILPLRGKVLPANGNGHELSVFVGPILGYCVWRSRHWLVTQTPRAIGWPLLSVSMASIVLGMGSLRILHVPVWLSPFDLLRVLPGFRSIGVTGRYWGFLALPLSLMSAMALWNMAKAMSPDWKMHALFASITIFQLGFQAETLSTPWLHSRLFVSQSLGDSFRNGPEAVDHVIIGDGTLQGEAMTPNRGVCNCYDMDDFTRADVRPGSKLIRTLGVYGTQLSVATSIRAEFLTWSHIRLTDICVGRDRQSCWGASNARIKLVLNQAYHRYWSATGCETYPNGQNNLSVDCPLSQFRNGPIDLVFYDSLSAAAARVSILSWELWMIATGAAFFGSLFRIAYRRGNRPLIDEPVSEPLNSQV